MKIYHLRGALGYKGFLEQQRDVIERLLRCDYSNMDLEKLHGHDVFSIRLNDTERLLFALEKIDGANYLNMLDYLPTHDYHKSRFLRSGVLKRYREKHSEAMAFCVSSSSSSSSLITDDRFHFIKAVNTPLDMDSNFSVDTNIIECKALDYYKGQCIEFNDCQNQIFSVHLPALISGVAGSGKSCGAVSLLAILVSKEEASPSQPILYIAKSQKLVDEHNKAFQELPLTDEQKKCVYFKTWQSFLLESGIPEQQFKGEKYFLDWYERYLEKQVKNAKAKQEILPLYRDGRTVYREFLVVSGASNEEEYQKLGDADSPIPQPERSWFYQMYHDYKNYLRDGGFYDMNFSDLPKSLYGSYAAVVADEAQDNSRHQLLQLVKLAENRQVLFCVDVHQSLDGGRAANNFLLHKLVSHDNHIVLNKSYRSAIKPLEAANELASLKQRLGGGLFDKHEAKSLKPADGQGQGMGYFKVLRKQELENDKWLQKQSSMPHCAIVTRLEFLEEAQKLFPKTFMIFTPEMVKGLEYDLVIAYRLGNKTLYNDMRKRLEEIGDKPQPQNAPKAGHRNERFATELNGMYTAYTRAKQGLVICEPDARVNDELLRSLTPLSDSTPPLSSWSLDISLCDWEDQLTVQIKAGNDKTAQLIFSTILKRDEKDFIAYKKSILPASNSTQPNPSQPQSKDRPYEKEKRQTPVPKIAPQIKSETLVSKSAASSSSQHLKLESKPSKTGSGSIIPAPKAPLVAVKKQNTLSTPPPKTADSLQKIQGIINNLVRDFDQSRLKTALMLVTTIDKTFWSTPLADKFKDYILNNSNVFLVFCCCYAHADEKLDATGLHALLDRAVACKADLGLCEQLKALVLIRSLYSTYLLKHPSTSKVPPIHNIMMIMADEEALKPLLFFLKRWGIDLNQPDANDKSLALIAAEKGYDNTLYVLNDLGLDLNRADQEGRTPAYIAAQQGNDSTLRVLSELGVNLNQENKKGRTPAFIAAQEDKSNILGILGGLKVDLNQPDKYGRTPIFVAAEKNKYASIRILGQFGANIHQPDIYGRSPAFVASQKNNYYSLRVLGELGADVDRPDIYGRTPTFIAAQKDYCYVLCELSKLKANLNRPDNYGRTPAFIAIQKSKDKAFMLLRGLGANLNQPDNYGRTPKMERNRIESLISAQKKSLTKRELLGLSEEKSLDFPHQHVDSSLDKTVVNDVFSGTQPSSIFITAEKVQLNCSKKVLERFQQLMKGSYILGSSFYNSYTKQNETFPLDVAQLTSRHLHILAHNSRFYKDEIDIQQMKLSYIKKLNDTQIALLPYLLKNITVAGMTDLGTSDNPIPKIVILQEPLTRLSGTNSSGILFFYPAPFEDAKISPGFVQWQKEAYWAAFGTLRPEIPSNDCIVMNNHLGVSGKLDLYQVSKAAEIEFSQAMDAVVAQGNLCLDPKAAINFKCSSMDLILSNIQTSYENTQRLKDALLRGILDSLIRIVNLSPEARQTTLGKIRRIELPWALVSDETSHNLYIAQIKNIVVYSLGLEWGEGVDKAGHTPVYGFTNAEVTYRIPALIGEWQSRNDTLPGKSCFRHLNPAFNQNMLLRNSPDFTVTLAPHFCMIQPSIPLMSSCLTPVVSMSRPSYVPFGLPMTMESLYTPGLPQASSALRQVGFYATSNSSGANITEIESTFPKKF